MTFDNLIFGAYCFPCIGLVVTVRGRSRVAIVDLTMPLQNVNIPLSSFMDWKQQTFSPQ